MNLVQKLDQKLESLEQQELQIVKLVESLHPTSKMEEEYLEVLEIPLSEELYQELCKAIGSDKIRFMGIA